MLGPTAYLVLLASCCSMFPCCEELGCRCDPSTPECANQQRTRGQNGGQPAPFSGDILTHEDFEAPEVGAEDDYLRINEMEMEGWQARLDLHQNLVAYGEQLVDLHHDSAGFMRTLVSLPAAEACTLRFYYGLNGYCANTARLNVSLTAADGTELLAPGDLQHDVTCDQLQSVTDAVKLLHAELPFQSREGTATLTFFGTDLNDTSKAWPSCGATIDEVTIACSGQADHVLFLATDQTGSHVVGVTTTRPHNASTELYRAQPGEILSSLAVSPGGDRLAGVVTQSAGSSIFVAPLTDAQGRIAPIPSLNTLAIMAPVANGQPVRETSLGSVRWSEDSTRLAFLGGHSDQGNTLYVFESSGGFARLYPTGADNQKLSPENYRPNRWLSWWPGDQYADFTLSAQSPSGDRYGIATFRSNLLTESFRILGNGSNARVIWQATSEDCHKPEWSPDGSRLAFLCGNKVVVDVIKAADYTSHQQAITAPGPVNAVAWSPDLVRLAYSEGSSPPNLHVISTATMTEFAGWDGAQCDVPAFSPDGSKLLCRTAGRLEVLDPLGGATSIATDYADRIQEASWIPPGRQAVIDELAAFKVTVQGIWTAGEMRQILTGVLATDRAFRSIGTSFTQVFPQGAAITRQNANLGPCATSVSNGVALINCIPTARMTQYTMVHELGHAIDYLHGKPGVDDCDAACAQTCASGATLTTCNSLFCYVKRCMPGEMISDESGTVMGGGARGKRGWGSTDQPWFDMPSALQQHPCQGGADCPFESSGDLFLNWVYRAAGYQLGFQNWSYLPGYTECDGTAPAADFELWGCKDKATPGDARFRWTNERLRHLLGP